MQATITPAQTAALKAITRDADGTLQRCCGGQYMAPTTPGARFTARTVYALARAGLLREANPGSQARYQATDAAYAVAKVAA